MLEKHKMSHSLQHIAFIMDGNRRWARQHKLPIPIGHEKGFRRIESVVKHAKEIGIKFVTFWAFSTENWKRNQQEVDDLMAIFRRVFQKKALKKIIDQGARIVILGDLSRFPHDIQENVLELVEQTKDNQAITVNIALNYGGRQEILHAVNLLMQDPNPSVTEESFSNVLYTSGQPDPDVIIRTGGEKRLSGYLPWQSVYAELYFIDTYWPDFTTKVFDTILSDFALRERRFGK